MQPGTETRVLVLSYTYEIAKLVSWKKAIELVVRGAVDVVCEYDNIEVRSCSKSYKLPSIIRVRNNRSRRYAVKFSRENIYLRDNGQCQYCGIDITRNNSTLDHIIPKRYGGDKSWDNIVLSCKACNIKKGDKSLYEANMELLKKPSQPRYFLSLLKKTNQVIPSEWLKFV